MKPRVWIKSLTFSDRKTLGFQNNSITVFVGPNNVGKSIALKEIYDQVSSNNAGNVILETVIQKEGTLEQLMTYLETACMAKVNPGNQYPHYYALGCEIYGAHIPSWWQGTEPTIRDMRSLFCRLITTEHRLSAANPASNIALTTTPATHPIHLLQKDDSIEAKFSGYFRQAFGTDLIVHRNAGSEVPLYIGQRPQPGPGEDRLSYNYVQQLERLPKLAEQGDGMRSFVGVLLNILADHFSVLLIDEPEAFLHPPQARLLGKMLAKDLPRDKQLFLSTHSGDFLRGILDANSTNVKIIRVTRDGTINQVNELEQADIEQLWSDPLLRHSNILEGLFHSRVIICESDADCRFYSAILDASITDGASSPNILFVHCGGKHRIPVVINSLKKLSVPISVIADFDVLNQVDPLRSIVEALGGQWEDLGADFTQVKNSIDQKRPELNTTDIKAEISRVLNEVTSTVFPTASSEAIRKLLKKTSAWESVKAVGKAFVPNGHPSQAYERLSSYCKSKGLFIVEVGELESFAKSVGNHGPKWVNEVLQKDLRNDPELEIARQFIREATHLI